MQLTRLSLDLRSAQVRRDLADPYDMHRTLVRAFVSDDSPAPSRFLWRVEPQAAWSEPTILVQSIDDATDWSVLESLRGYLKKPIETKPVQIDRLLLANVCYRFRLFANPTVARGGRRIGLTSEDAQLAWLARQGERLGFTVETALITANDLLTTRKGQMRISLQRACYEGVLRALDVEALGNALRAGIGPGKAFGCGLLSLARC